MFQRGQGWMIKTKHVTHILFSCICGRAVHPALGKGPFFTVSRKAAKMNERRVCFVIRLCVFWLGGVSFCRMSIFWKRFCEVLRMKFLADWGCHLVWGWASCTILKSWLTHQSWLNQVILFGDGAELSIMMNPIEPHTDEHLRPLGPQMLKPTHNLH